MFVRTFSSDSIVDRPRGAVLALFVAFLGAVLAVWMIGSSNPFTPAGYVGYLTKGAVFGKSRFYGIQRGPTSAGRTWLLDVTNVLIDSRNHGFDPVPVGCDGPVRVGLV